MENAEPSASNVSLEVPETIQPSKVVHLIPRNSIKTSVLHVHVSKEPKYVPYEPYKAAVNPKMPSLKPKKAKINIKKKENTPDVSIHQPSPVPQAADISKEILVPENTAPLQEEIKQLNISDVPVSSV